MQDLSPELLRDDTRQHFQHDANPSTLVHDPQLLYSFPNCSPQLFHPLAVIIIVVCKTHRIHTSEYACISQLHAGRVFESFSDFPPPAKNITEYPPLPFSPCESNSSIS